jgi:hypothetical protein
MTHSYSCRLTTVRPVSVSDGYTKWAGKCSRAKDPVQQLIDQNRVKDALFYLNNMSLSSPQRLNQTRTVVQKLAEQNRSKTCIRFLRQMPNPPRDIMAIAAQIFAQAGRAKGSLNVALHLETPQAEEMIGKLTFYFTKWEDFKLAESIASGIEDPELRQETEWAIFQAKYRIGQLARYCLEAASNIFFRG